MAKRAVAAALVVVLGLALVLFLGHHRPAPPPAGTYGAAPGPLGQPAAVQVFDENLQMTGTPSHPTPVAISGTSPDGGTAAPQPVDTTPGDLLTTVVHFVVATTQGVVKASSGTFVGANCSNEGTATGWVQVYFGQTVPDAGGTANEGTAPSIVPLRVPAGAMVSIVEPQPMVDGGVWYSSSTQGLLTVDAGVPNMACDFMVR